MSEVLGTRAVAQRFGIGPDTVRWYERIGLLDRVTRGPDGRRRFNTTDLGWLELLLNLRRTGMSIADMQRYVELVRAGHGEDERLALLRAHRVTLAERIAEQQSLLEFLDTKIAAYTRQN